MIASRRASRKKRMTKDANLESLEGSAKPTRFHLANNVDLETEVSCEEVKRVSEKESTSETPSLKLCTPPKNF